MSWTKLTAPYRWAVIVSSAAFAFAIKAGPIIGRLF